jgi:hypothetical protein
VQAHRRSRATARRRRPLTAPTPARQAYHRQLRGKLSAAPVNQRTGRLRYSRRTPSRPVVSVTAKKGCLRAGALSAERIEGRGRACQSSGQSVVAALTHLASWSRPAPPRSPASPPSLRRHFLLAAHESLLSSSARDAPYPRHPGLQALTGEVEVYTDRGDPRRDAAGGDPPREQAESPPSTQAGTAYGRL